MPGPWDTRALLADPDDHAKVARALEAAGMTVVRMTEGGRAGHEVTASYHYSCGCVRTYKADLRTHAEQEFLTPCGAHIALRNSLTSTESAGDNTGSTGGPP